MYIYILIGIHSMQGVAATGNHYEYEAQKH